MIDDHLRALVEDAVSAAVRPLAERIADLRRQLDERLPSRAVTRAEAAEALGVSVDTIDRRIRDGELRVLRLGRSVRIDASSIRPTSPEAGAIAQLAAEARRR